MTTRLARAQSMRCARPHPSRRFPRTRAASPACRSSGRSATPLAARSATRLGLAVAAGALALSAPDAASAQRRCSPVELIYDANEQIAESRKDTNADCRFDEVIFYADGVAERAERDSDHDGRF